MRPHLVIDFRERCLFGLLIDESGNIRPCTHSVMEYTLKYFFGEIFLDSGMYLDLNEEQTGDLFTKFEKNESDIVRSAREIGWLWPYQLEIDNTAIPLKNPLKILSSAFVSDSDSVNHLILRVSSAILEFLLEPITRSLKENNFDLKEVDVTAVVPGYFSRSARLLLQKVLRRMKFNQTMIITREIAAAMGCLENASTGFVNILDMGNENTHLYRVEIRNEHDLLEIECSSCRTIPYLGWQSITKKFGELLLKQRKIEDRFGVYKAYLDKAFMGLVFSGISTEVPTKPPINLTQNLVDALFDDYIDTIFINTYQKLAKKTNSCFNPDVFTNSDAKSLMGWGRRPLFENGDFSKLKDLLQGIKGKDEMIVPIGMPLMLRRFEKEILRDFNLLQLPGILARLPLERTAYGLAQGLEWLGRAPDRKIKVMSPSTLRMVTGTAGSVELVSRKLLPETGEERTVKQIFDVHFEEKSSEDTVYFNIQWGSSTDPNANMNVCLLSLNAEPGDVEKNTKVVVTLELRKAKDGRDLQGNVKIELGEKSEKGKFVIDNRIKEIGFENLNR